MTQVSIKHAEKIINAIAKRYESEFKPGSIEAWTKELEQFSIEDLNAAFQRFKAEYESLPYRFSVAAGLLKQLKPTFTAATIEERLYTSFQAPDPWAFLANINPKLKELADHSGMFDRSISQTDLGFKIRDVAKRFLEYKQNSEKGFAMTEPNGQKALEFTPDQFKQISRAQNPYKGLPISEAAKIAAGDLINAKTR